MSSAWTILAMSHVIHAQLLSNYPLCNGHHDKVVKILNTTFEEMNVKGLFAYFGREHQHLFKKLGSQTILCPCAKQLSRYIIL